MKYLGLDYGTRRIGVAISDAGGAFAFAQSVISNDRDALGQIARLAGEEGVEGIVMGDTRTTGGAANAITPEAERFAQALERESGIPVILAPELWTSFEAARYAPDQYHDDSMAAAIILQRYLDMHASSNKLQ